jgi:Tfp pilus assembly protein PilP
VSVFAAGITSAIAQTNSVATKHDPFESLLSQDRAKTGPRGDAPAGIPGLVVDDLRLNGIVKSSQGLIAVVTNSFGRTYFLHQGAQLYDGRVEKISLDGVSFVEVARDAFGNSVERQVNKRIYSSAGEQQ